MYTRNNQNRQFAFTNQQVANSPYHLVKGFPDQSIIRQTDYDNYNNKPSETIKSSGVKFDNQLTRDDFLKQSSIMPMDSQFNKSDQYDKSTYLSTVKKVNVRDFNTQ